MGSAWSRTRQRRPTEETSVAGLLPFAGIDPKMLDIENLVFADCGSECFSYAGAVRVLENLRILPEVKRFAGVGNGAVIAAILALRLDSRELQSSFTEYLTNVQTDSDNGYEDFLDKYTEEYGWISGKNIQNWFGTLLEYRSFESNLTFSQLYDNTKNELCIVVTNVDKGMIEYCHPKTTPDLAIKEALYMAVSVPGIFNPAKYGQANDNCHYVNGTLLCNYPIHCFDGWLLSMNQEDSFLHKIDSPEKFYQPDVFQPKGTNTLGFFRLDKRQETRYQAFVDRLSTCSDLKIPRTTLGLKYKIATQNRSNTVYTFTLLKKACSTLLLIAEDLQDEQGNIVVDDFAEKVFADKSFTKSDRLLFPEIGNSLSNLNAFVLTLSDGEPSFSKLRLKVFIQTKLLSLLNQYFDFYKNDLTSVQSYFESVFDIDPCLNPISESDYNRTVGIVCRHVGPQDVDFEDDDQTFLYRQGWNSTVSYLSNRLQQFDLNPESS